MAITSGANRIAYLDGIRAIAIATVVAVHWIGSQYSFALGGYIGVDIFFVLSGYIITTMLWRSRAAGGSGRLYARFMKRRFFRLYPALAGSIVGTLFLYAVFPGAPKSALELIPSGIVALLQGSSFYAASGASYGSPFAATWSLSIEWMFYLLWPLAVYRAKRAGMRPIKMAQITLIAATCIYALSLFQEAHWFYYGPVARVPEILVGGALALILAASDRDRLPLRYDKLAHGAGYAVVFAVCAYTFFGPVQWDPLFRVVGLPLAVGGTVYLIWLGVRSPDGPLVRALSWGPLTLLGRVSYSLYLWHAIGVLLFTRDNMGGLPVVVVAILGVILAVALTAFSYRFLELPYMTSQSTALQAKNLDQARHAVEKTK